ncbi:hypothetical protein TWF788_005500 [Orbilia oligospora]|uniref:Uncharacterized protein n=1 Tax=Orbilia oligospora TaxID=2813651 RepID=A0A7C8K006_ORBOL|nr:hypothetical protein TWF788_005500 [Orbilia oligospora]
MPDLPALKVLKIFNSSIASPLDEFETIQFYKTAFYYLPSMLAPRLDELHIGVGNPEIPACDELFWPFDQRWEGLRHMGSTDLRLIRTPRRRKGVWKRHCIGDFIEGGLADHEISLAPELLKKSSKITRLKIFHPMSRGYLDYYDGPNFVVERFPNLRSFELGTSKIGSGENSPPFSSNEFFVSSLYFGIGKLKYLRDVTLPWPKWDHELLRPEDLPYVWEKWAGVNIEGLETVVFNGVDYECEYDSTGRLSRLDYNTYVQTRVGFKVKLAEGGRMYEVADRWVKGNLCVHGSRLTKPLDFGSCVSYEWENWWRGNGSVYS